ncbi:MAG: hypothetical protein M3449_09790 [Acidobacteriota bacterium]|nr:hypothetical protein [Acidobacteriota bacterium]
MKKLAIEHHYLSGFLVFLIVTSFGSGIGFLISHWQNYEALDGGYFILLSMKASLLCGVFSGLFAALFLEKKSNKFP